MIHLSDCRRTIVFNGLVILILDDAALAVADTKWCAYIPQKFNNEDLLSAEGYAGLSKNENVMNFFGGGCTHVFLLKYLISEIGYECSRGLVFVTTPLDRREELAWIAGISGDS